MASNILPPAEGGWHSYWLLFMASLALVNTFGNYLCGPQGWSKLPQLYPKAKTTPLHGRAFAIWTLITAATRIQAAYHPEDEEVFVLAMITFAAAGFHWITEWLIYGTLTGGDFLKTGGPADVGGAVFMFWVWWGGSWFE